VSVEGTLRIPFARPARHMKEYPDVLLPAMTNSTVDATGEIWSGNAASIGGMPRRQRQARRPATNTGITQSVFTW